MPISYEEMHGSPQEALNINTGWTATRQLLCDWDDRDELMIELLGEEYDSLILGTGTVGIVCLNAAATPFNAEQQGTGDVAAYEKALVTANYGRDTQQGPDVAAGDYFEDFVPTAEFLTVDSTAKFWKYDSADKTKRVPLAANTSLGKLFAGGDYILKRFGLTAYPTSKLSLIGYVNSDVVATRTSYLNGLTFAAQTLLFMPPTMEYVLQPDGSYLINATYRMNYKPTVSTTPVGGFAGHNLFWFGGSKNPTLDPDWLPILNDVGATGTPVPVYKSTAFGTF
jgi:hypothetical protein